ncbi:hypothetical protein [Paracoccus rhizosphaerae]|uniref:Membrane-anchored ribosome-binding protein, inhibits growth in stationary phase, ElaB/YqjD/DUF883 family n=1 Tax=Paracoccus rhizosphaerae TaxID=1133347 RepID=A0ABV6CK65_9RHOB
MSAEYTSDTARTQQTSSTMKDLKDQAGSQANRLAEGVKDEVSRRSEEMRGSLAERVDNLASAFRSAKSEVGEESPFARMFDYAAENAEGFADTLEGANVVDSVREFARERPGTFLGLSAVAGFAAARFLLAGKPGRTYSSGGSSAYRSGGSSVYGGSSTGGMPSGRPATRPGAATTAGSAWESTTSASRTGAATGSGAGLSTGAASSTGASRPGGAAGTTGSTAGEGSGSGGPTTGVTKPGYGGNRNV